MEIFHCLVTLRGEERKAHSVAGRCFTAKWMSLSPWRPDLSRDCRLWKGIVLGLLGKVLCISNCQSHFLHPTRRISRCLALETFLFCHSHLPPATLPSQGRDDRILSEFREIRASVPTLPLPELCACDPGHQLEALCPVSPSSIQPSTVVGSRAMNSTKQGLRKFRTRNCTHPEHQISPLSLFLK